MSDLWELLAREKAHDLRREADFERQAREAEKPQRRWSWRPRRNSMVSSDSTPAQSAAKAATSIA